MRFLLLFLLSGISFVSFSQYQFIPWQETPIIHPDSGEKAFPWAGGLNGVQYGKIDLNNDGVKDLAGFDRSTARIICFLKNGNEYEYAPQYEKFFPSEIQNFFILKDYNNDGRTDLFTAGNLGITAFRNVGSGNLPEWERVLNFISYESLSGNDVNLQVNFNDYPYIGDIDNDGDVDILNYSFSGIQSRILFYENKSIDNGGNPDLTPFQLVDNYWGTVEDCDCGVFAFDGEDCQNVFGRIISNARHAGGKSLAIFDFNEDSKLELVSSHEECRELYYFNNAANANQAPDFNSFTAAFPNQTNAANFNFYPNTMIMDISDDEQEELIISPNVEANFGSPIDFSESNWLYKKSGTEYELVSREFLQNDMVDWGAQTSPSFYDDDQDGDLDLFLSYTDLGADEELFSAIAYYENIGDPQSPSFELITDDYLNLSEEGLANMFIQWVDVDLDGKKDLVLQGTLQNSNQLRIIFQGDTDLDLNSSIIVEDVFIGFGYSVHFADVVGDNHPDLLVGKSSGGLILYENTGAGRAPQFQLENNTFLEIGDDFFRSSLRVHVSDINNDTEQDLIASDLSGNIRVFSELSSNEGTFDSITIYNNLEQSFDDAYFGKRNNIVFAPLFSDDYPALILGTVSGGIRIFRNSEELPVQSGEELVFQVYPNPNKSRQLYFKTNQDISVSISTLNGQQVLNGLSYVAFSSKAIDVSILEGGVYIVTATFDNGNKVSRKVVLY
ncbi:Por secretion system C-terminal sorting domain-containing protein [Marivirga sericea]|uniref:Por secretion system C-terminal sorting domain-containing protein n=1 Tax=Marivirga sericea TaxID=1028 RepID=A0A1X7JSD1_9BACT|nr:FG-GAP-like repeat-containing protein [Marivirga sericea]SMG30470.1 Por secretion system C-terminal sorting domain-containing protein [Marivirga sericea]